MFTEDEAHEALSQDYSAFLDICSDGFQAYRTLYPNQTRHRLSTRASIVSDEMVALAVQAFDGRNDICLREITRLNLRLLKYGDGLLLWFKKLDGSRLCSTFPTKHSKEEMHYGQESLFPDATILIVGYLLNKEQTKVSRVSILKPAGYKQLPHWYIDLERAENILNFPGASQPSKEGIAQSNGEPSKLVRVTRSSQLKLG
jgi:hypothetical protein